MRDKIIEVLSCVFVCAMLGVIYFSAYILLKGDCNIKYKVVRIGIKVLYVGLCLIATFDGVKIVGLIFDKLRSR